MALKGKFRQRDPAAGWRDSAAYFRSTGPTHHLAAPIKAYDQKIPSPGDALGVFANDVKVLPRLAHGRSSDLLRPSIGGNHLGLCLSFGQGSLGPRGTAGNGCNRQNGENASH